MTTERSDVILDALGRPLEKRCDACNGAGRIYSAEWRAFNEKFWAAKPVEMNEFEREQWEKANPWPTTDEEEWCVECEGKGYYPTQLGRDLLAFLRRYSS